MHKVLILSYKTAINADRLVIDEVDIIFPYIQVASKIK